MIIINVPIEPIEERYSIDWDKWFKNSFEAVKMQGSIDEVITIYGVATSRTIHVGSFLDVVETNLYKLSQLMKIIDLLEKFKKDTRIVLFFHDLWFPGLEMIAYIRDGLGLTNLKITGCLHAGSYDPYDFLNKTGMTKWADKIEMSWFNDIADMIFVATNFHKKLLIDTRMWKNPNKIKVTGFPFYTKRPMVIKKENIVVFPHRMDSEKNPQVFTRLAGSLVQEFPDWLFLFTKEECKTKNQYYDLLSRAKIAISCADQETWGIAMQEALDMECAILCPDGLSYHEMYCRQFLYSSFEELKEKLRRYMLGPQDTALLASERRDILERGSSAIPNIINELEHLF